MNRDCQSLKAGEVFGIRENRNEIDEYIKFFNEERPAYSLNYLTPKQFRETYMQVQKKIKKIQFLFMRIQNMLTSATRSAMLCSTTAYNISYHQSCKRREVCNSRFCLFSDSSYSDRLKPLRSWSQRMPSCRNRCFSSQSDKFENDQPYNLSTSSMTKESFCSL